MSSIKKMTKGGLAKLLFLGLVVTTAMLSGCGSSKMPPAQLDFTGKTPPAGSAEEGYQWADNTLTLNGLKLTADGKDGIRLPDGANVRVEGASEITLTNTSSKNAAIRSVGSITLTGTSGAPLTLDNSGGVGLLTQANLTLTDGAELVIRSGYDGIDVASELLVDGDAQLDITAGGGDSEYLAGIYMRKGKMTVDGANTSVRVVATNAEQHAYAIQCNGGISLLDGTVDATSNVLTAGKRSCGLFAPGESVELLGGKLHAKGALAAFMLTDLELDVDPANPAGGVVDKTVTLGDGMVCSDGELQTVFDDAPILTTKEKNKEDNRWAYLSFAPAGKLGYDTANRMITGATTELTIEPSIEMKTQSLLNSMTIEEKIGQVLLMDFRHWGKDAEDNPIALEVCNDTISGIIKDYHLGNIILFGQNVQNTEKAVRLVEDFQKAADRPLLMGIDQEGGSVTRLGQGTCLPGNMALGASGKVDNAQLAGKLIGEELAAVGVNCNFAPVSDVNDNPQNPVIHLRSFSADPQVVSDMAKAVRKGLDETNIISAAKHFPGHGNTAVDTHVGLAVVDKSRAEWDAVEAVPFRAMIEDGVDIIMSAHIQYPQLDNTKYRSQLTGEEVILPATLSKKILTGILRDELGFDGVISTDAMAMNAIVDNFGESEACVMALAAGADLLCVPTTVISQEEIAKLDRLYADIKAATQDGRLPMERLDDAVKRVLTLKLKRGILDGETDTRTIEEKVENALAVVGSPAHRQTERTLANDAITLYSDKEYQPLQPKKDDTILFLVPYENKGFSASYAVNRLIGEGKLPEVQTESLVYEELAAPDDAVRAKVQAADYIILITQMAATDLSEPESFTLRLPQLLAQEIKQAGKLEQSAVISIGLPNDAMNLPDFPVYIAYGYQGITDADAKSGVLTSKYGPNLPAAIDCIFGAFTPTGKLPVAIK